MEGPAVRRRNITSANGAARRLLDAVMLGLVAESLSLSLPPPVLNISSAQRPAVATTATGKGKSLMWHRFHLSGFLYVRAIFRGRARGGS